MALTDIEPITRNEAFLEDIAEGNAEATLDPITREEEFLRRIAVFNATEKSAVLNIYDKIPVDPESTDVGKVMTVVEDTSGEDPVYKWSAEEPASSDLSIVYYKSFTVSGGDARNKNDSTTKNTLGDTLTEDLRTQFTAVTGDKDRRAEWIEKHFRFKFNGIEITPTFENKAINTSLLTQTIKIPYVYYDNNSVLTGGSMNVTVALYMDANNSSAITITVQLQNFSSQDVAAAAFSGTLGYTIEIFVLN